MGTGDYICVTMSGGAPWGFRLQGGKEYHEILHVSKVRSKSKASVAGLCVGDEVMSINGNPCTDIPYSEVVGIIEKSTDSLQMFVKRSPSKPQSSESKNGQQENINRELGTESTMLQIRLGPETVPIEQNISEMQDQLLLSKTGYDTALLEVKKDNEVMLEHKITPRVIETSRDGVTGDITLTRRIEEGAMVELQLSLPQDIHLGSVGSPTLTLLGVDQCTSPETEHIVLQDEVACEHLDEKEPPRQQTSASFQIVGKQQAKIISAGQTGEVCFPRVELILDCSGREKEPRSQSDRGSVISGEEGGQTEAPPSTVSFGIKAEDLEEGEEAQQAERELIRPNKHRARHAKLRRSESLSEKQVKEAKSKCKSIALLLTAAPNPNSKGVLMFKKRRQRARKFTLTSYGTGELERQADDEDDNEDEEDKENTFNVTFYGASESDLDDDFFSDPENNTQIVTFNWDTGLVEVEKKLNSGDAMEELPETKGKGVLMFARRKQRMDQITAEQEELRKHSMEEKVSVTENVNNTVSFQIQQKQSIKMQSCVSKSYIEVSNTQSRVQNGFPAAHESIPSFQPSSNKTPKPFGGSQNRAAVPFSPTRNIASPMSDVPGPPPYSSVTPPPEPRFQVSSPVSAKAQAAVWAPSFSTEQIASRDERISVPANKTGILQEAKRRSTKPMFTFKEQPKISPRPELLTLVQTREGKRSAGNESGPEEDYLSLGAEACNFMQAHAGKQKTPPPVAPKPSVRSPTAVPTSPVWAPPTAAPAPQVISVQNPPHIASPVEDNVAQPKYNSYNPPTSAPVWAPPTAAPAPQVFSSQFPPQSAAPIEANVAQPKYNSYNPPPAAPVWAPSTAAPAPQVFSSQFPPQSAASVEANVAQPKYNSYNPPTSLNLSGPLRGPPATAPAVNQLYTPKTPPTTPSGTSAVGTAYEMPALRGKGAELFARRQSRMEKFIVDSTTVQEKAARPLSPTPSLPSSWKYSSNVRAPPPLAYNPIQSPLYPPAANKSVSKTASAAKKKPTKTLSALQVMKHQPYQLNSSLFTFQAPSDAASDTEAPKKNTKSDFVSSTKQATFNRPVNTAPSSNFIPAPENPQPVYNTQASQASAFNQSRETYPIGYPMQPRQESPITPLIAPPRPKFSAKKAGATAQERDDGRDMSFPARSLSSASSQPFGSPISPMLFQPAPGYAGKSATTPETPGKRLTPWEAAAKSPLGFVDDAFMSQTVHESVSAKIVSAARRKTLPEPPAAWKNTSNVPTTGPYAHKGLYENKRNSISTVPKNVVSAPSFQCGYQLRHPYSSTHSITNARSLPLETRSEYGMSTGHNPNFNPYPRAWRS